MLQISTCPSCGSREIKRVRRKVTGTVRGRTYSVAGVVFYECPDCGERLYDREAMQKIAAARRALSNRPSKAVQKATRMHRTAST